MKKLLLIGTALLSVTSYVSAMNSITPQPSSGIDSINSTSVGKTITHTPSLPTITDNTPPIPIDPSRTSSFNPAPLCKEAVESYWEILTDALANTDVFYNEFETQFKEFQQSYQNYKDQKDPNFLLNPKPLNEAIKKLFEKMGSTQGRVQKVTNFKSQQAISEQWINIKQQFPEKLALFINQNLQYQPISNQDVTQNFNFLRNPNTRLYDYDWYPYDINSVYFDLLYYASSIFRNELTQGQNFTSSKYEIFPWRKYKIGQSFPRPQLAVVLPYLEEEGFPSDIDPKTSYDLAYEILGNLTRSQCFSYNFSTTILEKNITNIAPKILQSLDDRGFVDILACPPEGKTSIVKKILDNITRVKNARGKDFLPYAKKVKTLQECYKMVTDKIMKTDSPKAIRQVVIDSVADGSKLLDQYSDDDPIFQRLLGIIVHINDYIDTNINKIPLSDINSLNIPNYVQENIMKPLQDEFEGEKLQDALGFIKNWINKTQEILDDQVREAIIPHISKRKNDIQKKRYWEQLAKKCTILKNLQNAINKEDSQFEKIPNRRINTI